MKYLQDRSDPKALMLSPTPMKRRVRRWKVMKVILLAAGAFWVFVAFILLAGILRQSEETKAKQATADRAEQEKKGLEAATEKKLHDRATAMITNSHFDNPEINERIKALQANSDERSRYIAKVAASNDWHAIDLLLSNTDPAYQQLYDKAREIYMPKIKSKVDPFDFPGRSELQREVDQYFLDPATYDVPNGLHELIWSEMENAPYEDYEAVVKALGRIWSQPDVAVQLANIKYEFHKSTQIALGEIAPRSNTADTSSISKLKVPSPLVTEESMREKHISPGRLQISQEGETEAKYVVQHFFRGSPYSAQYRSYADPGYFTRTLIVNGKLESSNEFVKSRKVYYSRTYTIISVSSAGIRDYHGDKDSGRWVGTLPISAIVSWQAANGGGSVHRVRMDFTLMWAPITAHSVMDNALRYRDGAVDYSGDLNCVITSITERAIDSSDNLVPGKGPSEK
jgi:hypothetical protein